MTQIHILLLLTFILIGCNTTNNEENNFIHYQVINSSSAKIDSVKVLFCDKLIDTQYNDSASTTLNFKLNKGLEGICYEGNSTITVFKADTFLTATSGYHTSIYDEANIEVFEDSLDLMIITSEGGYQ